jgi:hypothetical protein
VVDVGANAMKIISNIRKIVGDKVDAEYDSRRKAAGEQTATPTSAGNPLVPTTDNGNTLDPAAAAAAKKRIDEIKKTEAEITAFLKAERDRRSIDAKVGLDKELAEIDLRYADQLLKAATNADLTKQLLDQKALAQNDAKVEHAKALAERLRLLEEENFITQEELRFEREALAAETQSEKDLINLEREQFLAQQKLDAELQLSIQRLELANATEDEIFKIKQKYALDQQRLDVRFSSAKKKLDDDEKKSKKEKFREEISEAANATGQLAELLGKQTVAGKAASIASATMNTWQGVTQVWKSESVLPEPMATISKALSTVTVIASGLKAVGAIKKQDTSVPGYEDGFYSVRRAQDGKRYSASFGGNPSTQIVPTPKTFLAGEMPEMIIDPSTFKKMDPAITDYILGLAGKNMPAYESGRYPEANSGNNEIISAMAMTLAKLNERLELPFVTETYYGADASRKQQEYDKKIRETRNNAKIRPNGL